MLVARILGRRKLAEVEVAGGLERCWGVVIFYLWTYLFSEDRKAELQLIVAPRLGAQSTKVEV